MHESFEMWLKEHKEDLMKAFNGGYCMPGEMPPFRNMTWEVFTQAEWGRIVKKCSTPSQNSKPTSANS